ncbi:copia protein [Tanacetum coccineum]
MMQLLMMLVKRLLKNQQMRMKEMVKKRKDELQIKKKEGYANSTNRISTVSPYVSAAGQSFDNADDLPTDPFMSDLEDTTDLLNTGIFSGAYDDDEGAKADLNNLETTMNVSPIPTTRIHKDHPKDQIIGDINSVTQTRRITQISKEHAMVFRNKKDERGIIVRNKARLVAQCYTQEEGIDYDEVFAPVARIEAIRLFLAYASFMGFIVYQMDVKSAFLYDIIEEEVYVCQPPSFEDPQFPDKVYKVKQKYDGIFISQDKYVADILKKFDFATVKTASTPIETNKALLKDKEAEDVDVHLYRSMIGSLMYLTAFRPDIMFVVCAYTRLQVTPKVSHLHVVKRIFRYLKAHPKLGLWYPRDSPFDLFMIGFGAAGRKLVLLGKRQVYAVAPSYPQKTQTPRQAKRGRDTEIPQFGGPPEKVGDEAVHKELGDKVERDTTTAASLDAEQDSGNILKTQSMAIPNVPISQEIASYDSPLLGGNTPGSDEERLEQHALTNNLPQTPHDSPLPGALSQKVEGLESNLKKIKKLYYTEFKKLINRVKSLEDELKFQKSKSKRRRLTLVTSKDEEDLVVEDPFKQGRKGFGDGKEVSIVAQVLTASTFVSTASPQRNADTTADDLTLAETLMEIKTSAAKDKGKAKIDETESPRKMK